MQHTHTQKAVIRHVEAKKVLSRRRKSDCSKKLELVEERDLVVEIETQGYKLQDRLESKCTEYRMGLVWVRSTCFDYILGTNLGKAYLLDYIMIRGRLG